MRTIVVKLFLESILYNLISNALKFQHKVHKPKVRLRKFLSEDGVALEVEDNGVGMDLSKVGMDLFKFKKIFHRHFDSRGIGLFMVKYQVEALGGKISAASTPAHGSRFAVNFGPKSVVNAID